MCQMGTTLIYNTAHEVIMKSSNAHKVQSTCLFAAKIVLLHYFYCRVVI